MNPSELSPQEQAHYYHTIQYFCALVQTHGAKQIMEDIKVVDLLTYDSIMLQSIEDSRKSKLPIAALFRKLDAS